MSETNLRKMSLRARINKNTAHGDVNGDDIRSKHSESAVNLLFRPSRTLMGKMRTRLTSTFKTADTLGRQLASAASSVLSLACVDETFPIEPQVEHANRYHIPGAFPGEGIVLDDSTSIPSIAGPVEAPPNSTALQDETRIRNLLNMDEQHREGLISSLSSSNDEAHTYLCSMEEVISHPIVLSGRS